MDTDPRIDCYQWAGGREAMLRFGPQDGLIVVLALPLFEEANRTRAFGVSILRALAARGIGGVLPELPGQGESAVATADARLADMRAAFAAVPGSHAVAIRSGALLVDARPCWLLSPQDGPTLLRELSRVKGGALAGERVEVAGNMLSRTLLDELSSSTLPGEEQGPALANMKESTPSPILSRLDPGVRRGGRLVRLTTDAKPADRHLSGDPPWRRAEPDNGIALAQTLADDIVDWIVACEG